MNPLVIYIGMIVFALIAYLIARAFHEPVTRTCHQCGSRVMLGTRRCKRCGYVAEWLIRRVNPSPRTPDRGRRACARAA